MPAANSNSGASSSGLWALGSWLTARQGDCQLVEAGSTTSQLVRSVFQSIMGSYEGVFSAEPAVGDHPRGAGEARGAGGWVPDPPGHAKPGCALGNESPAGRSAGGWVPGCGRGAPPTGAGSQRGPYRCPGGWWGPGSAAGGSAAASQGYLLSTYTIRVRGLQTGLCSAS
jgi:hypothetical protein